MQTVSDIFRFPVKSMGGESVAATELSSHGVVGDRTWALRDVETGKVVSAKRPRLWRQLLECTASGSDGDVEVTLPDGTAMPIGEPALAARLSELLDRPVEMLAARPDVLGSYDSDWPELDGISLAGELEFPNNLLGEGGTFIDVGVLHVLTTASLRQLAAVAPDIDVDIRRFRPSFVVDIPDETGFVENEWEGRVVRIGSAEITFGGPAPRCIMTTVAQGDLPRQPEVLQALAAHNRLTNPMGTFACLGAYATVTSSGTISVGDEVVDV